MERIRVFIVEDEPLVLAGYIAVLESANYEVIGTAQDGMEAIDAILKEKDNIDIAVVDVNIPSMDGIEVVKQVNSVKRIPFIIVTGYRDEALIQRADKAGVFGYLQKPVDKYDLISCINIAFTRFQEYKAAKIEAVEAKIALRDRKIVEQAKGILMDKFNMGEKEAMVFLQKKSRDKNRKLVEIAKDIIKADKWIKL